MKKVGVISLGCDKNRVDTEYMLHYLQQGGYELVQSPEEAQILIVNTCAFLESSRKESIDTILEMAQYKTKGNCEKLIVTGCLSQMFSSELAADLPEVDAILGINEYPKLVEILDKCYGELREIRVGEPESDFICNERILTTPPHTAYLKIADGCNNFCSYCLIPAIRGRYRSKPLEEIVLEAKKLLESGVRELILVAQDVTRYGFDLYRKYELVNLIQSLSALSGVWKIRLLYCYPELVTDELIAEIKNNPKVAKYIDIPLQHISDSILRGMRRRSTREHIENMLHKVRQEIPGIVIRSTFIVGFPNETQNDFNELLAFLKQEKLEYAGFFKFSREENTRAAEMDGQVSEHVKRSRLDKAERCQHEIMDVSLKALIGQTVCVICDGIDYDKQAFVGRTEGMAPDIDPYIVFVSDNLVESGELYNVQIQRQEGSILYGRVVPE